MITLNKDQEYSVNDMVDFFFGPDKLYALQGFAGVGKTTCMKELVSRIQKQAPTSKILLTAPTHKAVKVLYHMVVEEGLPIECATTYASVGLVLTSDSEIRHTKRMSKGRFENFNLVIVDEASMVPTKLFEAIEDLASANNVKVIFMGDSQQLNPVKEKQSLAFDKCVRGSSLTKIMRQEEGNPIIELTSSLRNDVANRASNTKFIENISEETGAGIHIMSRIDWMECLRENFNSKEYLKNPDLYRAIAWTNKRVNNINRIVRKDIYGITESPYIAGERVVLGAAITDENGYPVINNAEECEILSVEAGHHPDFMDTSEMFKVWDLLLMSSTGAIANAYIIHEDSFDDHNNRANQLRQAAYNDNSMWKTYWGFDSAFAKLNSTHALTTHKSQGSSFENVFIDLEDIFKNRNVVERSQLLYVACSRARQTLVLLGA